MDKLKKNYHNWTHFIFLDYKIINNKKKIANRSFNVFSHTTNSTINNYMVDFKVVISQC